MVLIICVNPKVDRNMNEFEEFIADGPFSDPCWVQICGF